MCNTPELGGGIDLTSICAQTARFTTECSKQLFTVLMPCCCGRYHERFKLDLPPPVRCIRHAHNQIRKPGYLG